MARFSPNHSQHTISYVQCSLIIFEEILFYVVWFLVMILWKNSLNLIHTLVDLNFVKEVENMAYCKIPPQLKKVIEEDLESGKYLMSDERAKKYFDTISSILGVSLKPDIKSKDIVAKKYEIPLSQIVRDYRKEKYD